MRPGARAAAAIEILADLEARKRPAAAAVKDWMLAHRFAGARDRAEIGDLVFAALRLKSSSAWRLGADNARAWVIGALIWGFGETGETLTAHWQSDPHAPPPLTNDERERLAKDRLVEAATWVRGDYPEWMEPSFERAFGEARAEEGAALARPAPLDLRVNALKADRPALIAALADHPRLDETPRVCPYAETGVRIPWRRGGAFAYAQDRSFLKGWYEVQDEASQLAAALTGAQPGMQVADVCAGAGGKTLALAAAMENKGQIYAHDWDDRRLAPLRERLERSGARNVQIRAPRRTGDALEDLRLRMDVVLVDAPCTGVGTWRRNPDAKWRVRPTSLEVRQREQQAALALAAPLVKPGGRLVYVTCSMLPEENDDAIAAFVAVHGDFTAAPLMPPAPAHSCASGLLFTPAKTGTDGFYVAALRKTGS
jgi:16S rRNA (cytosine967-C5)-methyltransferase